MTWRLVNKQVLVPMEFIELTAFLSTLEFEGKFFPESKLCSLCILNSPALSESVFMKLSGKSPFLFKAGKTCDS